MAHCQLTDTFLGALSFSVARDTNKMAVDNRAEDVKRGSIWLAFAGLSGGIEAARNAFANRHNSVTCTYTF